MVRINRITLDIDGEIMEMINIGLTFANTHNCQVRFLFKDALVSCNPHESPDNIYSSFQERQMEEREKKRQELRGQLKETYAQLELLGEERVVAGRKAQCLRGHPRTPENLNKRSGCLLCLKILRTAWRLRQRGHVESTEIITLPI